VVNIVSIAPVLVVAYGGNSDYTTKCRWVYIGVQGNLKADMTATLKHTTIQDIGIQYLRPKQCFRFWHAERMSWLRETGFRYFNWGSTGQWGPPYMWPDLCRTV